MTAVQTPMQGSEVERATPEITGLLTGKTNVEAAVLAELQTAAPTRWMWTRDRYHQAGELGLFGPEERLELIEGEVYRKVSPQSSPHAISIGRASQAMRQVFTTGFRISEEKPIVLNDLTEPEPDIVVARGEWSQTTNHPTPADIVLVIEVSLSTLKFDQTEKAAAYARSGIDDYWTLNVPARQLEVRRDPGPMNNGEVGYRLLQIVAADGQVSPLAAPDVTIRVADLLPSFSPLPPDTP